MGDDDPVDYDSLSAEEQAAMREQWGRAFEERLRSLDLAAEFEAAGTSYSYLDGDGQIVTWHPTDSDADTGRQVLEASEGEPRRGAGDT